MASEYLIELNNGLWERLAHPSARRSGGIGLVPAPPKGTAPLIRRISAEDLARVSYELTQGIAQGSIGGIPLREHFRDSLEPLYGTRHNACQRAVAAFLRTPHAHGIDMLGLRRGRSVIEAFGDFLGAIALNAHHASTIRCDTLAGLVKTLTRAPEPGFTIADPGVYRTGTSSWVGYFDLAHPLNPREGRPAEPMVFASCEDRYFSGRVSSALLAALLDGSDAAPSWVHSLDLTALRRSKVLLIQRGLLK